VCGASGRIYRTTTAYEYTAWSTMTSPSSFQINAINTIDGNVLYVVGNSGNVFKYTESTWNQLMVSTTTSNLYSLSQISDNEVYILGANNFVAKTADGGVTWSLLSVFTSGSTTLASTTRPPHAVSMLTSAVGLIGSTSGALRQTVNGGATWYDAMTLAASAGRSILTVSMYSSNVGVAGMVYNNTFHMRCALN
jgi:photosystem II stability/assembly factor-like uncharacterized protein